MSSYKLLGEIRLIKVKPQDIKFFQNDTSDLWSLKGTAKIEGYGILDVWLGHFPNVVNKNSAIFANVKEIDKNNFKNPFIGDAVMKVHHVVSTDDGNIYIRIEIEQEQPLSAQITFLVFND